MFNYLKAKNHKGISQIFLMDLGRINVLCGKNDSGKTSILEALDSGINSGKVGLGKKFDQSCIKWFSDLLYEKVRTLSAPNPNYVMEWFRRSVEQLAQNEPIWFSDDLDGVVKVFQNFQENDNNLKRYSFFNYVDLVGDFFKNSIKNYETVLIPPKRSLEYITSIDFQKLKSPNGLGITNRLFYLKNQDLESNSFKTYRKILDSFKIVTGYNFNIVPNSLNQIELFFKREKGEWIKADSCGLGLSDMLIIISFVLDSDARFIFIEEPENHLHPEVQKRFLSFIKCIRDKQFIISTHSSVFLNPHIVDRIFLTEYNNGTVMVSDETSKSEILYNLGYSVADNLVSDVVVLVEGPTDIPIIETMLQWVEVEGKYNVKYWPLGGDIMADLDLAVIAEKNKLIALIDRDPGSSKVRTRFKEKCKDMGIECHQLDRYAIENYFTLDAIKKSMPGEIPETITELKHDSKIDEQIQYLSSRSTIKSMNSKIILNMTLNDITGTDLYEFCIKVRDICQREKEGIQPSK